MEFPIARTRGTLVGNGHQRRLIACEPTNPPPALLKPPAVTVAASRTRLSKEANVYIGRVINNHGWIALPWPLNVPLNGH